MLTNLDYRLLLIGHDLADAAVVHQALTDSQDGPFTLECLSDLTDGLERLSRGGVDIVLLDLGLPDNPGLASLHQVLDVAPEVAVVVLSAADDERSAREAVELGAQDYVLKGHIDSHAFPRALRAILDRRASEEALFNEKERAEVTLNSIGDAVISTDVSGRVTYFNLVAERMTGWRFEEVAGQPLDHVFNVVDAITREPIPNRMDMAIRLNTTIGSSSSCVLIRRDGFESAIAESIAPIHDRRGHVTGAVMVFHDVSAARAMSLQMSHLAAHDWLTNLPNRMLLNDRLSQAIAAARRQRYRLGVVFLDLDRFKQINDSLGHSVGDTLLQSVAGRLVETVRRSDTVSRLGGDEFVLLLSRVEQAADAASSAQKVIKELARPFDVEGHQLNITVSVGVSIYPDDGHDAETLIKNADAAMYIAKKRGYNSYQFYKPEMNVRVGTRGRIEAGPPRTADRRIRA